jgi:hypothetical protein
MNLPKVQMGRGEMKKLFQRADEVNRRKQNEQYCSYLRTPIRQHFLPLQRRTMVIGAGKDDSI